jgi:hypothetical protein
LPVSRQGKSLKITGAVSALKPAENYHMARKASKRTEDLMDKIAHTIERENKKKPLTVRTITHALDNISWKLKRALARRRK